MYHFLNSALTLFESNMEFCNLLLGKPSHMLELFDQAIVSAQDQMLKGQCSEKYQLVSLSFPSPTLPPPPKKKIGGKVSTLYC